MVESPQAAALLGRGWRPRSWGAMGRLGSAARARVAHSLARAGRPPAGRQAPGVRCTGASWRQQCSSSMPGRAGRGPRSRGPDIISRLYLINYNPSKFTFLTYFPYMHSNFSSLQYILESKGGKSSNDLFGKRFFSLKISLSDLEIIL